MTQKSINDDFQDFLVLRGESAPLECRDRVFEKVRRDLNPTHSKVFGKLMLIQGIVGILTLLFCPQFELSLTGNEDLFHFFHRQFGEEVCSALCGAIFLGVGAFFAARLLHSAEVKLILRTPVLYYLALGAVALSGFWILGAKFYFGILVFWLLGGVSTGIIAFGATARIRSHVDFV